MFSCILVWFLIGFPSLLSVGLLVLMFFSVSGLNESDWGA